MGIDEYKHVGAYVVIDVYMCKQVCFVICARVKESGIVWAFTLFTKNNVC